jgi:hypothetical protein
MFSAVLRDGTRLTESECMWHDMSRNVDIVRLEVVLKNGGSTYLIFDSIEGFDAYGFQKYQVHDLQGGGKVTSFGCQLLGVDRKNGKLLTVDINPFSGRRVSTYTDLKDMSYNPELLRNGHVRG